VRFVLDQDVDAGLVGVLVRRGHDAWTVASAGIPDASDDDISVYAAKLGAVVVTHDEEFSARRRRNPHGGHIPLGCSEPDAISVVEGKLDALIDAMTPFQDVFVYLSKSELAVHLKWT
jgi:hypothetical protein